MILKFCSALLPERRAFSKAVASIEPKIIQVYTVYNIGVHLTRNVGKQTWPRFLLCLVLGDNDNPPRVCLAEAGSLIHC